jgi:glycosyltransferase involved in cell wall biosynthesis
VPFATGKAAPQFLSYLDAIRQTLSSAPASVVLSCSESAHPDSLRQFRRYAETSGLSIEVSRSGLVELINAGIKSRPVCSNVLLLDPRVLIRPQSVQAMAAAVVASDMSGFAVPRSNAATVAQFPRVNAVGYQEWTSAEKAFCNLSRFLPEVHFVPAPPCDCLLIRGDVMDEFGFLDSRLSGGGVAKLDLVLRANRCGYSAVLANRAYAWRSDTAAAEREWAEAIEAAVSRYPELRIHMGEYLASARHEADRVLGGFAEEQDGRRSLLFDLSSFAPYHNGTFEAGRRILESAVRVWSDRFRILAMASSEAGEFHRLGDVPGIQLVPLGYDRPCAVAFRFGQPFLPEHVKAMARAAPINVWMMLDTIAWDCMYLRRPDLEEIWAGVLEYGDASIYISETVKRQFHARFRVRPTLRERVVLLSLDVVDYNSARAREAVGEHLLIVGNSFAHKRVAETAAALSSAFPDWKIVCLGGTGEDLPNVQFHRSGELKDRFLDDLFCKASVVIFPSTHEGFGLPILRGLGCRKPVVARSIPATREVAAELRSANLLLYSSTPALIELLRLGLPTWQPESTSNTHNWSMVAAQIGAVLDEVLNEAQDGRHYEEVLLPRIQYSRGGFSDKENARRVVELEASLSWRITRPLRMLADLYLRLWKGGNCV